MNEEIGLNVNLKSYQKYVRHLAKTKGYNQELFYLFSRLIQEAGELLDAIWQKEPPKRIGEEGADLLHFFFQMIDLVPDVDIDNSMVAKIKSNYSHKKKTNQEGKMVRK